MSQRSYRSRRIGPADLASGFRGAPRPPHGCFHRHALTNDQGDVGRAYVIDASPDDVAAGLPSVLGFFTLGMATVASQDVASILSRRLPRYPMPVALIGRLAVDERARGRGLGEALLLEALGRVVEASRLVACLGVVVDAKDATAEDFYARYDFVTVDEASWPRRMFLPIQVARAALDND